MHSDLEPHVKGNFLAMVARLEGSEQPIDLEVIDAFTDDSTLAELIEAIQRDIQANKPNAVLDRLHTYSMKKFAEGRIRTTATDTLSPINAANLIEAHHRIESATTRSEIVLEGWDGQQV